jgi:hypothetical protein
LSKFESDQCMGWHRSATYVLGLAIQVAVSTHRVSVSTRLINLVKNVSLTRHKYVINGLTDHKRVINRLAGHKQVINWLTGHERVIA